MKVALLCHNYPPEFAGGTERVTRALARALAGAGDEVCVISGSDRAHSGRDVLEERLDGLPVFRVLRRADEPYGVELLRPRVLHVVEALWQRTAAEVVHLHHWSTLSVRMLRAARARGLATVATLHDLWAACPRFFRRPPEGITCPQAAGRDACVPCAALDLEVSDEMLVVGLHDRDQEIRAELAAAQFLCTPSTATARAIRTHVPWAGPIEVVPHGLLEPVGNRPAESHVRLRIGTFGNLVEEKGVLVLVEAMAGIAGAELHLHGPFLVPEFDAAVRERAAELGVALTCHGPFTPAEKHPARMLDLAVFPSLCEETYGLVVEEALARGVPVVISDAGALAERIGDGGCVVARGDVAALHRELARLAAEPAALAQLRRGIPATFPTVADAARQYRSLYSKALAAR